MASKDFTLFIDTNMYLELFKLVHGSKVKEILNPLNKFKDDIFITHQIVNEIERNKLNLVSILLNTQYQSLSNDLDLKSSNIPDHLFSLNSEDATKLRSHLANLKKEVDEFKRDFMKKAEETLNKVMYSNDEISLQLKPLYALAHAPTKAEQENAERRQKTGSPPGKREDPLGDQLSWEQLLNHCKGKKRVWIITRDSDYSVTFNKKMFLNAVLHQELTSCGIAEIKCYSDLIDGLRDFAENTGGDVEELPDGQEADALKETLRAPVTTRNDLSGNFINDQKNNNLYWSAANSEIAAIAANLDSRRNFDQSDAVSHLQALQKMVDDTGALASLNALQNKMDQSGVFSKIKAYQKMLDDTGFAAQIKAYQKMLDETGFAAQITAYQKMLDETGFAAQIKAHQKMLAEAGFAKSIASIENLTERTTKISTLKTPIIDDNKLPNEENSSAFDPDNKSD